MLMIPRRFLRYIHQPVFVSDRQARRQYIVASIDLCMFSLYQPYYYQIKGKIKDIRGFNAFDPEGWGE